MNILLTSSGRRVSLVKMFKQSLEKEGLGRKIYTVDMKSNAPTAFFSDEHFIVPRVTDNDYIKTLLDICLENQISVVIPTIDTELLVLSNNLSLFKSKGINLLISEEHILNIFSDKNKTYDFFKEHNIRCAETFDINFALAHPEQFTWPMFAKPVEGSRSVGARVVEDVSELKAQIEFYGDSILQEYIDGQEYTVDVYVTNCDFIKTIVPRKRVEVRDGEISKGKTVRDPVIIEQVHNLLSKVKGFRGVITVQCFLTNEKEVIFNEINPRFGGGAPLSIRSGADFPRWILEESQNSLVEDSFIDWEESLSMVRFDEEFFYKDK